VSFSFAVLLLQPAASNTGIDRQITLLRNPFIIVVFIYPNLLPFGHLLKKEAFIRFYCLFTD